MSKNFPMVLLGEVLVPVSRPEPVNPNNMYHILGAHWYAKGLYVKDIKSGSGIQANKVYRVELNDFVYNRLFAWKGSFAVATEENHGRYVSNEFPYFRIKQDRVDSQYLLRYFSRLSAWESAFSLSTGGTPTSRNRLKEEKLLAMKIPLPPLHDQQRIVARIEELTAKVEEARGLRREAVEEAEALGITSAHTTFENLEKQRYLSLPLNKLAKIFGGGTPSKNNFSFWKGDIPWVSPKDMKIPNITDTEDHISTIALSEGAVSLIPKGSVLVVVRSGILRRTIPVAINRVPLTINQDMKALIPNENVSCDYLAWWFKGKESDLLKNVKGGTTVQSLVWDKVSKIDVCLPPLPEQRRIVAYLDDLQAKVDALKQLQTETSAELDALLPSILDKAFKGEL